MNPITVIIVVVNSYPSKKMLEENLNYRFLIVTKKH